MPISWNGWLVVPLLAVVAVGALIWKKKQRTYEKVGRISKLLFFPMKSINGIEVTEGNCTDLGFEVNGLLDRSFMLLNEENIYLSLIEAPKLALLTPKFSSQNLIISGPNVTPLTIKLESTPNPKDEIIECQLIGERAYVVDCGETANKWFQDYLNIPNIRLVRNFPSLPKRKYVQNHPFYQSLRKKYAVSLQNLAAFHVLSQSSVDDLNERLGDNKTSIFNFRPNIVVDGCYPYSEDSWKYIKFGDKVEIVNATPSTRCILTTYDPDTGILTQKEPLITLRKYRIPQDKEMRKKLGSKACLGVLCFAMKNGTVKLNDDVFAVVK